MKKEIIFILFQLPFCLSTIITYTIPTHPSILDFWTTERIANAKPLIHQPPPFKFIDNQITKSISKVEPISATNHTIFPFGAIGRVLFTNSRNVTLYCGGVSTGGSAVFTAGQCVSDGYVDNDLLIDLK